MKNLIVATLFIFMLSLSANSQPLTTETTIYYETDEFSIDYPEDWDLNTDGVMGSIFFLFSPLQDALDDFRDNLSLMKEDLSAVSMDLDDYVELSEKQIAILLQNYNIIESKRQVRDDVPFHSILYTGTQGSFDLKIQQYYWIINNTAYVLTFSCEQEEAEHFVEVSKKLMDSFQLNKDYISPKPNTIDGQETTDGDITTYSTDKFSIQYPNDWILNAEKKLGMEFILLAPSLGEDDKFNENLTLAIEDLSGYEVELEDYVSIALSQINKVVIDGKVIYNQPKTKNGLPFYHTICSGTQGNTDFKYDQYYWIIDEKAYIMTFTCPVITFDQYQALGEMIMDSFTVNK